MKSLRIALVAGEQSGDQLGAGLIRELRARAPSARFMGVAGPRMIAEGCEPWGTSEQLAVMGLVEVLSHLPGLYRLRSTLQRRLLDEKPDVFVGIDAPEFNLGLARRLRAAGLRTVQYVSPQVWAWRRGRVHGIASAVDPLQQEAEVIERQRVIGTDSDHAPEGLHRLVHVLFRLRQAECEQAIDVRRSSVRSRPRPLDRLAAPSRLGQRQREIVVGSHELRPRRQSTLIGIDRRVQRADAVEGLSQAVLDVRVARRLAGGFPEQRQRGRMVTVFLELQGARVGGFGVLMR